MCVAVKAKGGAVIKGVLCDACKGIFHPKAVAVGVHYFYPLDFQKGNGAVALAMVPFSIPKAGIYTASKKNETENCTEHLALSRFTSVPLAAIAHNINKLHFKIQGGRTGDRGQTPVSVFIFLD